MLSKVLPFLTTFKYWLIALAVLLPLMYVKGCSDGRKQVEAEYSKVSAEIQKGARKASETASAEKQLRDQEFQKQNEELRDGIVTKTGEPVGTNTRNVLDGMRRQQSGGSNKTADCVDDLHAGTICP